MSPVQSTARRVTTWAFVLIFTLAAVFVLREAFFSAAHLNAWTLGFAAILAVGAVAIIRLNPDRGLRPVSWAAQRPLLVALSLGVAFAVASYLGALVLLQLPATEGFIRGAVGLTTAAPPFTTFAVAFIAGCAEELWFRVGLARLLPRPARWVVPNLAHGVVTLASGNLALALCAPFLGVFATTARETTGRWWGALIVHGVWTIVMVGIFPLTTGLS